jgi:hypothetical protein
MTRLITALIAVLFLAAPLAASAQEVGQNGPPPSYSDAPPPQAADDANIHGRILQFDGGYNLQVRDEKGYVDNVQLHQGTIINPTGLTLAPGMIVSIMGYNAGPVFAANEIDTPYQFYSGVPYYGGHPWFYYGPTVSLGFFFGSPGWWHGNMFAGGGYRWVGGARVYNNVHVNAVYRGGAFQGRNYVAPAERGGYRPGAAPQARGYYGNARGGGHEGNRH